jgi:integrase
LPDSIVNRKAASIKARTIELDMTSGNFDPSLAKYKPQKQESISVSNLFHQFIEYKRRKIEPALHSYGMLSANSQRKFSYDLS